jgi:hypothetical protein
MLNLEFAQLVEQDRRREIEAQLKRRRYLEPDDLGPEAAEAERDRTGDPAGRRTAYRRLADPVR